MRPITGLVFVSLALGTPLACSFNPQPEPPAATDGEGAATTTTTSSSTTTASGTGGMAGYGGSGATSGGGGDGVGGGGGAANQGCFADGAAMVPTGSGSCVDPYVLDLSAVPAGEVRTFTTDAVGDDEDVYGVSACEPLFASTGRDIIFQTLLAAEVTALEISVDGVVDVNPIIGVLEDDACGQPINPEGCSDEGGVGECEYVFVPKGGTGFYGTEPFVSVSETTGSATSFTVRVRTVE